MPWSQPAARMREFASALRAIWHGQHTGERLRFRGDCYTHTLMTPMFGPGPLPSGPPRIWLVGVGRSIRARARVLLRRRALAGRHRYAGTGFCYRLGAWQRDVPGAGHARQLRPPPLTSRTAATALPSSSPGPSPRSWDGG
ncbi:hypothetical protein [Streptomyces sp. NPDC001070]